MMFNATFNNISAILWQSVLLVEETGVPEKTTDLSVYIDIYIPVVWTINDVYKIYMSIKNKFKCIVYYWEL